MIYVNYTSIKIILIIILLIITNFLKELTYPPLAKLTYKIFYVFAMRYYVKYI